MIPTSIFSSFNAKTMTYLEIAQTFVPSAKFEELLGNWHILLLGPRGSGKTTLLKMLSLEGVRLWDDNLKKNKEKVGFTGIYIPADSVWGGMISSLGGEDIKKDIKDLLIDAAFTTNVLMAVAHTLSLCQEVDQFRSLTLDRSNLKEVIQRISKSWMIIPESFSFRAIKHALSDRLIELQKNSLLINKDTTRHDLFQLFPYIGLSVFELVGSILEFVNDISNNKEYRWALLFDEFEIAPEILQIKLFEAIRGSRHQHILYKVALAPCGPHTLLPQSINSPTVTHDLKKIELWYADKQDSDYFCEQLFLSKIKDNSLFSGKTPKEILGDSLFPIVDENGHEDQTTEDIVSNKNWINNFEELQKKDESFKSYLKKKNIQLDNITKSSQIALGNTIRKISPIVGFRNAYRNKDGPTKWRKKEYRLNYYGWSSISAISEGNPRWLIGIISGIFSEPELKKDKMIPHVVQGKHIAEASNRFGDILRTATTQQFAMLSTNTPVFLLLEKIGNYFFEKLIFKDFVEDPPMSFIVDDDIDLDIENCLRIALNHGAIVCYESADQMGGFHTLKGKRFRLSYLLSPEFHLPIRKSIPVKLKSILKAGKNEDKEQADIQEQISINLQDDSL